MGALHEGHAALLRAGRKIAGPSGTLLASIFVNPTQFGPGEDFQKYPRTWKSDLAICKDAGVDGIFAPSAEKMYAPDRSVTVEESRLSKVLCGTTRPGHFQGVCTVVAQLFHILQPDAAVFGQKDYQQLAVLRRMVRDLHFPVRVIAHPTVREKDGLAMSSRNRYLSPQERLVAPGIYRALKELSVVVKGGSVRVATLKRILHRKLARIPGAEVIYAEIVDAGSLASIREIQSPAVAAVAVRLGTTRLIDNLVLLAPGRPPAS